ncbi:MAG: hypothetical protein OZSIB_0983 [Candidatus Ozemobacter sibiricus]|jgi:hypothetical protein|uniref:DUF2281 domain-containing protein n=1 Tax=Candidatus Ozemobacter sibiricus TaxID=2268124 RepID=A0A367ZL72_9BACT|nr:MAG: hypothetical protein OZSIB_0983 [Candidatus Ozemobacter sibiricus]
MTTKEQILGEIEKLPPEWLDEVLAFVRALQFRSEAKGNLPTFDLGGQFDQADIRHLAHE